MATDERIEDLLTEFDAAAAKISDYAAEMPLAEEDRKRELYLLILALLLVLRKRTHEWGRDVLTEIYIQADAQAMQDLEEMGLADFANVLPQTYPELERLILGFEQDVGKALDSVQAMASRFRNLRGSVEGVSDTARQAILAGTLTAASRAEIAGSIRNTIRDKMVSVIGKDGKSYGFSLVDFIGIVAAAKVAEVITFATSARADAENFDLLQVSPQPSTIGDYCDEYKGKVVSRSGTHPLYPPMSILPNGGAPFHPRCHHVMRIYTGVDDTGDIGEAFVELGMTPDVSPNDFQSLYEVLRAQRS